MGQNLAYEDFKGVFTTVLTALVDKLSAESNEALELHIDTINKNGKALTGLTIRPKEVKGDQASGVMYLEELYEIFMLRAKMENIKIPDFNSSIDFENDAGFIAMIISLGFFTIDRLREHKDVIENMEMPDVIGTLENLDAAESLQLRILPVGEKDMNFSSIPHNQVGDIAVTCAYVYKTEGMSAACTITTEMVKKANADTEKLFEAAFKMSQKKFPEKLEKQATGIYTVSAPGAHDKGIAIFYPGVMKTLARRIGDDLLILPVTTDVVYVVDASIMSLTEAIDALVHLQHGSNIPGDILSKSVFKYSRNEERLDVLGSYIAANSEEELKDIISNLKIG